MATQLDPARNAPLRVNPIALMREPHSYLAHLRADHAIVELGDSYVLALRAQDVLALLADPRTEQIDGPAYAQLHKVPAGAVSRFLTEIFVFGNGASHRAKRSLFARAFSSKTMRDKTDDIRAVADRIVAELPRGETFDFVEAMAARLPSEMIASILGLPLSDATYFAKLVADLALAISPVYPHAAHPVIEAAASELSAYVSDELRNRLHSPAGDLLSTVVKDWAANPLITFDSLVQQVIALVIGGTDTTRAGFAMLVSLLLQHPRQWRAVGEDASLIPGAVNEALRYEPPVGTITRLTVAPLEIDGVLLPSGTVIKLSTLSALRDPMLYAEPDRFDIHRTDHPRIHPVFGSGPHRCIGEMLARLEIREGLAALAENAPQIALVEAATMSGFGGIRQISPMKVRID
ncbi:cytochrome P450 [Jiella mangrovi]|uniref:Cytochrome P450 n=1 Tax=Jiella mangrovi TaxID=2821407 RepID=A0ABS4BFB9_9HYPH|nr:cytochrome P450 [Jiella mangrovi]MBP0615232.1 cytochrome P450 [Jiella mangrovi]